MSGSLAVSPCLPTQVLSSRLAGVPAQVWARVSQSGFIASYLGAQLPTADLAAAGLGAPPLRGTGADGRPLVITVTELSPPNSLSLRLCSPSQATALRLAISACAGGSRLTVLHQPDVGDPAVLRPTAQALAHAPGEPGAAQPTWVPADGLAGALARALPARLQAGALADGPALQEAIAYLGETVTLVAALCHAMSPRQGYALPVGGGFSLVQHLWHLADVEQWGWSQRFARLLVDVEPLLPGVDGDRLATEGRYQQRPWRGAARRFIAQRRRTLAALGRCNGALLRRPVHFSGQASTGAEMLAALLAHDHEHRVEMAALWPPVTP